MQPGSTVHNLKEKVMQWLGDGEGERLEFAGKSHKGGKRNSCMQRPLLGSPPPRLLAAIGASTVVLSRLARTERSRQGKCEPSGRPVRSGVRGPRATHCSSATSGRARVFSRRRRHHFHSLLPPPQSRQRHHNCAHVRKRLDSSSLSQRNRKGRLASRVLCCKVFLKRRHLLSSNKLHRFSNHHLLRHQWYRRRHRRRRRSRRRFLLR